MTGKSPFAHKSPSPPASVGLAEVWSLAQGDRLIILVCQIILRNIFWVFATGGDSEFVQRRGEETQLHNNNINNSSRCEKAQSAEAEERILQSRPPRWSFAAAAAAAALTAFRRRGKRQEVELSQLSMTYRGTHSYWCFVWLTTSAQLKTVINLTDSIKCSLLLIVDYKGRLSVALPFLDEPEHCISERYLLVFY